MDGNSLFVPVLSCGRNTGIRGNTASGCGKGCAAGISGGQALVRRLLIRLAHIFPSTPRGKGEKPRPPSRVFLPLLLCCLMLAVTGCTLRSASTAPTGPAVAGAAICNTALSTIGTRYASGGTNPAKGFDCSGLVSWAYAQNGVPLPRTAKEQSKVGKSVSKKHLRAGDLVVFKVRGGMHTGIYTGRGKFVHSPSRGKNVREDNMESEYWRKRFVAGRRHERLH